MTKAEKEAVREFLLLIGCSVATRCEKEPDYADEHMRDNRAERVGYLILCREYGVKP